jgi:hypothetical protein
VSAAIRQIRFDNISKEFCRGAGSRDQMSCATLPPWPAYDESDIVQVLGVSIEARPHPQADRFGFLGSFREDGVLAMRWRA